MDQQQPLNEPTSQIKNDIDNPVSEIPTNVAPEPKRSPEEIAREVLEERSVKVFRPANYRFDPRRLDLPDDFFEPTSSELKVMVTQQTSLVERLDNAPLMTRKMREAEEERRMSRFKKVLIRIQFPDRVALQGIFVPKSTIRQVIRFVRAALLDARNVKFHLFVTPPKRKLTEVNNTLWKEALVPAALIHIGIDEGPTETSKLLKPHLLEVIEDTPEANPPPLPPVSVTESRKEAGETNQKSSMKKSLTKKVPKWFKK